MSELEILKLLRIATQPLSQAEIEEKLGDSQAVEPALASLLSSNLM